MVNRLDDFKTSVANRPVSDEPQYIKDPDDTESGIENKQEKQEFYSPAQLLMNIPEFVKKVDEINALIKKVNAQMHQVELVNRKAAAEPVESQKSLFIADAEARIKLIQQTIQTIRNTLKLLQEENLVLKGKQTQAQSSFQVRVRKTASLQKAFLVLVQRERRLEEHMRAVQESEVKRQYLIINPKASVLELEAVVKDEPGARQSLFAVGLKSQGHLEKRAMEARLVSMRELSNSINQLAVMFADMQTMVIEQQHLIDRIEGNVSEAEDHLREARDDLEQSVELMRAKQRRKWIIIGIVIVVILIILISVLIKLAPVWAELARANQPLIQFNTTGGPAKNQNK